MPGHDLTLLRDAVRAAGEIARGYFKTSVQVWEKSDDAGPVTQADLAVNDYLKQHLSGARPAYGWLSEETEDAPQRLTCDSVFIVDPIDGTRAFIDGQDTWAHSVAVAQQGQIVAGAVYLPMLDRLFLAEQGQGATLNDAPIRVSPRETADGATVLGAKPNFDPQHWPGGQPQLQRQFRSSLAYRMALVAQGRFDAMLSLRNTWEWDIAAGTLIASEAGARVTNRLGHVLPFNSAAARHDSVVCAGPDVHAQLIAGLRPG